jgi:uncharacterized membrane protein (Fun14 family)
MVVDTVSTPLISFAGSGVAGFFIGMLLRRVLHILMIIVGSFFGILFLAIQYMSNKGYLGNAQVDWTRIGYHKFKPICSPILASLNNPNKFKTL